MHLNRFSYISRGADMFRNQSTTTWTKKQVSMKRDRYVMRQRRPTRLTPRTCLQEALKRWQLATDRFNERLFIVSYPAVPDVPVRNLCKFQLNLGIWRLCTFKKSHKMLHTFYKCIDIGVKNKLIRTNKTRVSPKRFCLCLNARVLTRDWLSWQFFGFMLWSDIALLLRKYWKPSTSRRSYA